jgi:hypothetical protein
MEASYVTELQWAGQDKRDSVASEVVHWIEVAKDRVRLEGRGRYMIIDLISYKMVENFTKMAGQLPGYQVLLVFGKCQFSAQHCSLTQRQPGRAIWYQVN